jgi:hypothetical protein
MTLLPGIYYIGGGGFTVGGNSSVTDRGRGAMIYNAVPARAVSVGGSVALTLNPLTARPYQGLTVSQARNVGTGLSIAGNGKTRITGTACAAGATVSIAGNRGVASRGLPLDTIDSLIVAAKLSVSGNGSLAINVTS